MTTIGIDLGTTHSLVGVFQGDSSRVFSDAAGRTMLPSVVAVDDGGRLLIGASARARSLYRPNDAVSRFKPYMGDERQFALGSHSLSPVALSALVLREMRLRAEEALGHAVTNAVITVPAWFREASRRATIEAARIAGLGVRQLLNEPTAAALAYGVARPDAEQAVAVLDLGGGTFDVTILELYDGMVDVRASGGDVHLGGEDYTDMLSEHLKQRGVRANVRAVAERTKRQLSQVQSVDVPLGDGQHDSMQMTREAFAELTSPLNRRLRRCIQEAMLQAGLRASGIDVVLLVGGAVRMPMIRGVAAALFEREPLVADEVDTLVARGAAIQAALIDDHAALREVMVTDVLTHSLGVETTRYVGEQVYDGRFCPVLSRGTTLPVSRVERFYTVHPRQDLVQFNIFEGEHRLADRNEQVGSVTVSDLPLHPAGSEEREALDVRFSQDTSGLLHIDIDVVSTGATQRLTLMRSGRSLDEVERKDAEERLSVIAVHPRDQASNRELLEVASSLIAIVPSPVRDELEAATLFFESVLDKQEPDAVARAADALSGLVRRVIARYDLGAILDHP